MVYCIIQFTHLNFQTDGVDDFVIIRPENIIETDLISVLVHADGLVQRNFRFEFSACPDAHQDFIFNAAGSISGKPGTFFTGICIDCLNQADGTDGNQIILAEGGSGVFFCNMCNKAQVVFNQNISCLRYILLHLLYIKLFFLFCQWLWKTGAHNM